MDFSDYGHPSPEWLSFLEIAPSAAQEGFTSNEPKQAGTLRSTSNEARRQKSAKVIAEERLDQRVHSTTITTPSRGDHSIPLRTYRPRGHTEEEEPSEIVLYLHGGGFLFGDETTDDLICYRIAAETRAIVVSVIYRHTDKHQHPAQVDDAWDAFLHVRSHADALGLPINKGLVVLGISAGCTLAASIVYRELEETRRSQKYNPIIKGALFAIPWLIHIENYPIQKFKSPEVSAKLQNANTAVIPCARLELFSMLLGAQDVTDALLNVALLPQEELRGWPPTVLQVAGADPLRDDGLLLAEKLESMQ